jgi:glycosyltransferase involved in cell wall biosynthesis
MIFAQTNRYGKRQDSFSSDDRQGAGVAHAELLRAVVMHSNVEAVEVFVGSPPNRSPVPNPEFTELCREFPGKSIRLRSLEELGTLSPEMRHVFYSSGIYISPIGQARRATGTLFPICSLSHALDIPLISQFMPGALLASDKRDTIITSSLAGKRVLESFLSRSRELLGERMGTQAPDVTQRIEVIPLGVNTDEIAPKDRGEARNLLRIPSDALILLYLGRLSEEHKADIEPLLVVLRALVTRSKNVTLLIAGHDHNAGYIGELEAIASQLGVRNNVRFLINFQEFLKPYIYSASDIFVAPSDNIQETFGIAILEAMACGLPVVASDWSGYRELVVHNHTGFLVPTLWNKSTTNRVSQQNQFLSDEARRHMLSQQTVVVPSELYGHLERLISNPDLRRDFGHEGLARVRQEFSWQAVVKLHEALWDDLWAGLNVDEARQKRLVDDLDFSFGHFATCPLDPDSIITRSSLRDDIDYALRSHPSRPGYDMIDQVELRRVWERTILGPTSVRQLLRDRIVKDTTTIAWLLKKGFLSILNFQALSGRHGP